MTAQYASEEALVAVATQSRAIERAVGYPGWNCRQQTELEGYSGIPDVFLAFGKLDSRGSRRLRTIAIEAKLADWRRGLRQAYRYSAFCHYSYVLLDASSAATAVKNLDLFRRSNIGLLSIDRSGEIRLHLRPRYRTPYCPPLHRKLRRRVAGELFE